LGSFYINGWGADFGDPINFLGQETYGDDNAYYSQYYSMINKATDEKLIATYKEFTQMVNDAKAISNPADKDARYAAFAKAEAFMLNHALTIPCNYEVLWELTCINDYSKINSAYGIQNYRYVNWETNSDIYTTEDYTAFAAK
jgi:oligopeptide transport system substrate-binding protein